MRPLVILLVRALICVVQTRPLSACTPPKQFLRDKQAVFADARFLISWTARFSCVLGHACYWASSKNSRVAASFGACSQPWTAKNHSHVVREPYLRAHQELPSVAKHLSVDDCKSWVFLMR